MASLIRFHHLCFSLITVSHLCFISIHADTYIVHMDALAMPKPFSDHHSWYSATLSSLSSDVSRSSTVSNPSLIYAYTNVMRGFSASLSDSELELLEKSPGFISWTRDASVAPDTTQTPKYLGLNSQSGAWPESGYGKNVIIGVIDSGIWPESGSFKDHGMSEVPSRWKGKCVEDVSFKPSLCNKKLIGARFFNKGILAHNENHANLTGSSTRDTQGHGTFTSAIAAGNIVEGASCFGYANGYAGNIVEGASFFGYANGTARGIAPHAHLAVYKVLWDNLGWTSDIIAGIDQAITDGVDVLSISMSWGSRNLNENPIAIATFAAMEKGIFVATSAGNDGPQYYSINNGAPWFTTVGAGSVDREPSGLVTLGNGVSITGTALQPQYSSINQVPLVFLKYCDDEDNLKKFNDSIVVCLGDGDDFPDEIFNFQHSQASVATIFIGRTYEIESLLPTSFPALFLSPEQGEHVLKYINSTKRPTASMQFHRTLVGTKPAPVVGFYSSRGPSRSNPSVLKPDLIAPGTLILSSWPKTLEPTHFGNGKDVWFSSFNILSGTSMACPHVAGVGALLKSVHPEWSPATIRSAMMTTADSLNSNHNPIKIVGDQLSDADPLALGAGQINPNKALNPGLVYDASTEDYISFLCSLNYTKRQIMSITRSSSFSCSSMSSDLNYPSFIAFFNASTSSSTVKITHTFRRTVTNVGPGMSTYISKLTPINEVEVSVVPNKLVFSKKNEKLSFTLTIKGPSRLENWVVFGSLTWVDVGGKHAVRSPIAATRVNEEDIED